MVICEPKGKTFSNVSLKYFAFKICFTQGFPSVRDPNLCT